MQTMLVNAERRKPCRAGGGGTCGVSLGGGCRFSSGGVARVALRRYIHPHTYTHASNIQQTVGSVCWQVSRAEGGMISMISTGQAMLFVGPCCVSYHVRLVVWDGLEFVVVVVVGT